MFHLAPHNTLNTSTSSLSPTSPVLPSSSSPNPDLLSTYSLINPLRRQDFFHIECVDDTFAQICCTEEVLECGLQRLHRRFGLVVERDRRRKSHNTTIRQCSGVSKARERGCCKRLQKLLERMWIWIPRHGQHDQ